MLNDYPKNVLKRILEKYGFGLLKDQSKLQAYLNDLCGDHSYEIFLLLRAYESNIPKKLLSLKQNFNIKKNINQLVEELEKTHGLKEMDAVWAVESWVFALKLMSIKTNSLYWKQIHSNKKNSLMRNIKFIRLILPRLVLLSLLITSIIVTFSVVFPPFTRVMRIFRSYTDSVFAILLLYVNTFLVLMALAFIERKMDSHTNKN